MEEKISWRPEALSELDMLNSRKVDTKANYRYLKVQETKQRFDTRGQSKDRNGQPDVRGRSWIFSLWNETWNTQNRDESGDIALGRNERGMWAPANWFVYKKTDGVQGPGREKEILDSRRLVCGNGHTAISVSHKEELIDFLNPLERKKLYKTFFNHW